MTKTTKYQPLGPVAIAIYALATLVGIFSIIAFVKTGIVWWGMGFMFSLPAAGRLHANYFTRRGSK